MVVLCVSPGRFLLQAISAPILAEVSRRSALVSLGSEHSHTSGSLREQRASSSSGSLPTASADLKRRDAADTALAADAGDGTCVDGGIRSEDNPVLLSYPNAYGSIFQLLRSS